MDYLQELARKKVMNRLWARLKKSGVPLERDAVFNWVSGLPEIKAHELRKMHEITDLILARAKGK